MYKSIQALKHKNKFNTLIKKRKLFEDKWQHKLNILKYKMKVFVKMIWL